LALSFNSKILPMMTPSTISIITTANQMFIDAPYLK
jgi:hypothetical protein